MTNVLKLCCRLNVATTSCARLNSVLCHRHDVATSCARLNSVRKLCFWRTSTPYTSHGVLLLPHTKRVDGHGHTSICTSRRHLAFVPQNSGGFKNNRGLGGSNESSKSGSRDKTRFKFANARFPKTLLTVGGIVIVGVLILSSFPHAREEEEQENQEPDLILDKKESNITDDKECHIIDKKESNIIDKKESNIIDETESHIIDENESNFVHPGKEKLTVGEAAKLTEDLLQRVKDESGSPGLVARVLVDGKWMPGKMSFGYADVENRVLCKPNTVFRIASISKPITMLAVARLWEQGKLDLDKPVQHYVPEFPEKTWKGEKVTITTRQLLCHMAGIRHYDKTYINKKQSKEGAKKDEFEEEEYYIQDHYSSVFDSLDLFKDYPLANKPGSEFLYTTHGWTLISAVVERVAKEPFVEYLRKVLDDWKMFRTHFEDHSMQINNRGKIRADTLIYGTPYANRVDPDETAPTRAVLSGSTLFANTSNQVTMRHYVRNAKGQLENAPYTDLSYKWAGGGLISSVTDLVHFGYNILRQHQGPLIAVLKPETIQEMWTKVDNTNVNWGMEGGGYGMGWGVWDTEQKHGFCKDRQFFVAHTGGAVGASSVLLIMPAKKFDHGKMRTPQGVVVGIIVNMTGVSLLKTAHQIAKLWEKVNLDEEK